MHRRKFGGCLRCASNTDALRSPRCRAQSSGRPHPDFGQRATPFRGRRLRAAPGGSVASGTEFWTYPALGPGWGLSRYQARGKLCGRPVLKLWNESRTNRARIADSTVVRIRSRPHVVACGAPTTKSCNAGSDMRGTRSAPPIRCEIVPIPPRSLNGGAAFASFATSLRLGRGSDRVRNRHELCRAHDAEPDRRRY